MTSRTRQLIVIGSVIVLALAIVFVTQIIIVRALDNPDTTTGESVYFTVDQGESVDSIADRLKTDGLIRSPAYFRFRVRIAGLGSDIIAGRYRIDSTMSTTQIIHLITSREAALAQEVQVRFVEGWRTEQYVEALTNAHVIASADDFMTATREQKWNDKFAFLHTRPSGVALEGYLFPDTYNFRLDSSPEDVLTTLLNTFQERVHPETITETDQMGLTLHQVITIASIIEREAVLPEERPIIASVYYNRIEQGMPLQADPTVQFELGRPGNWWPELTPDDIQQNGRYNTYLNPDLPPGPICNPGLASIEAALRPAQTNYLYFVARGDGFHAFAVTAEEHQQNVDKYVKGH